MSSTFSVGGLVSGLDTHDIIRQLMQLERIPVNQLVKRQERLAKVDTAWQTINTRISALRGAIDGIRRQSTWDGFRQATSSNTNAVSATVTGTPTSGSVSFTVGQLAAAAQRVSNESFSGTGADMGTRQLTIDFASGAESIEIDGTGKTLAQVVTEINDAGGPVRAQAIKVAEGDYRLALTGTTTGVDNDFSLSGLSGWDDPSFQLAQAAQDAQIHIGGTDPVTITRSSNTITDFIDGVRLNLKAVSAEPVTITTSRDETAAVNAVKKFVDEVNQTLGTLKHLTKYDADKDKAEPLSGDPVARRITDDLLRNLSSMVTGLTGDYTSAGSVGISLTRDGTVELDESKLRAALQDDFVGVSRLFSRSGTATSESVSFIEASNLTQPGTYSVEVTQAAETARVGVNYNPPTGPITLTLNIAGKEYDLELGVAEDTAEKAADAINAQLEAQDASGISASADGGDLVLEGSAYGSAASFTVTTTSGENLGLDGTHSGQDVIAEIGGQSFTGKGRTLTVNDGPANGLVLSITATAAGPLGDITYSRGVGGALSSAVSAFEGTNGLIASSRNRVKDQTQLYQDRIDQFEVRLAQRELTLIRQFTAMETALQQLTAQGNWIASQLAGLTANNAR